MLSISLPDSTSERSVVIRNTDMLNSYDILNSRFEGEKFEAPNIAIRMNEVVQTTDFGEIMRDFDVNLMPIDEVAHTMATALCNTRNFTILHAVTSTHAFRLLAPYYQSSDEILYYFTFALAAAYVTIGAPKIEPIHVERELDWDLLTTQATKSLDDHIPKIVYSCIKETHKYGNPVFYEAAYRYINGNN